MTRRHGYASLAAIVAVVIVVSTAIYLGVSRSADGDRDTLAGSGGGAKNPAAPASTASWVSSWSASPVGGEPGTAVRGLAGTSLRNLVHTSVGGSGARVTLSNLFGRGPLTISHASLALAAGPDSATAAPGTMRRLTFRGSPRFVIPVGRQVVTDPVRLAVPHDADVLVSTYSPAPAGPVTYHPHARQTSFAARGDHTENPNGAPYTARTDHWRYVTALDVLTQTANGTVVVLGDSLTDGISSTPDANHRWTDFLAERLRTENGAPRYGVVNQGISGNRILTDGLGRPSFNPSGLSRFERDVLGRSGARAVVIVLGVNDILRTPHETDPARMAEGLRELTRKARERGLRVIGATLMPFKGHRGYQDTLENTRRGLNNEIRSGRVFDTYVDFDKAVRDPYDWRRLRPEYDSGDHLHLSDEGYQRMAQSFNLAQLRKGTEPARL
ncbi:MULTISPECIES: SGNH/GDSL hydrolase family protein [Streptomyces]|uniref:Secreted protein n=1 Tax=Streptomyces albus (strain ATCC 21838 / DSM 41398 / FERM P-419 / JCM 4703 / NBRC 107858) TaxID=1081613 RepID=A0A0B5EKL3_STRA4|nr:SGNH/GDSL hydrolase family protein [Streptomyces sp. SCSIO ZS0520]AJE82808.1 secreted protein [Streptomyces albus]AOU77120.1 secreted protein [Streptomyces albus]AYN32899.1 SGNH hydrolase [Streptomyces albus]